ncbi:TPA: MFS transporter [Candidatus Geothermarchaeota archaeon]|nr:MFS transporter [Candidatus Geothermarchaeota archaeon]
MITAKLKSEVNREVLLVIISVFLYFAALGGMGSIISRFSRELGASTYETGLIFSIGPIIGVLSRIPSGVYADKFGSKYFMGGGGLILFLAAIYASYINSYNELFLVRGLQGLSIGLFISASIAAVSLYGYMEYLYRLLSYRAAAISLSSLIGPPIVAYFVDNYSYSTAFIVVSLFGLSATLSSLLLPKAVSRENDGVSSMMIISSVLKNKYVLALFVLPLVNGGVFISLYSLQQDHIYSVGHGAIVFGNLLFIIGVVGLFTRLYAIKVIEKLGPLITITLGLLLESIGLSLLIYWDGNPYTLYTMGMLYGGGIGFTVPSGQYILLSSVSEGMRNTASSVYASGFDIGGSVLVVLLSYIAQVYGFSTSYLYMTLALLLSMAILYISLKRLGC